MTAGSTLFSDQLPEKAHLVRGGGLSGEVADLRSDIRSVLALLAPITVEEFVDPALADVDAIVTSIASAASETVLEGAALDGAVGEGVMSPPRNVTITTTSNADIDAVAAVVEGTDISGDAQTDTITLTDGGGATDAGTKAFATVTKVTIPAQSGTGGALEVGFGAVIGLGAKIVTRAGYTGPVKEIAAGSVVTNGTFVAAATSGPNGTYEPSSAPDGSNDYALYYEYAPVA